MTEYKDCLTKSAADYRMKNKTLTMMTARAAMTLLALFCILGGANAQKTLPYEYGFENMHVDDEGWSRVDNHKLTDTALGSMIEGKFLFLFYENHNNDQYLISPELESGSAISVLFWSYPAGTKYIAIRYYSSSNWDLLLDAFKFTKSAPVSLPYEFSVENYPEEGWSLVDCTEGTGIEDNVSHNGNYIFGFLYTTNPPQYLISPQFDGTTGMTVSFYYKNQMDDYPETFQVGYSTTNRSIDAFTWGNKVTANDEDRWYSLWECESSYSPPALVLSLSNARHPMLPAQSDSHRQRLPVACHPGSLPDNP